MSALDVARLVVFAFLFGGGAWFYAWIPEAATPEKHASRQRLGLFWMVLALLVRT